MDHWYYSKYLFYERMTKQYFTHFIHLLGYLIIFRYHFYCFECFISFLNLFCICYSFVKKDKLITCIFYSSKIFLKDYFNFILSSSFVIYMKNQYLIECKQISNFLLIYSMNFCFCWMKLVFGHWLCIEGSRL